MLEITNKVNNLKNQDGMDDFDREAEKCGQAIRTLDSYRPFVSRKKVSKVRIENFLKKDF